MNPNKFLQEVAETICRVDGVDWDSIDELQKQDYIGQAKVASARNMEERKDKYRGLAEERRQVIAEFYQNITEILGEKPSTTSPKELIGLVKAKYEAQIMSLRENKWANGTNSEPLSGIGCRLPDILDEMDTEIQADIDSWRGKAIQ